MGVGAYYEFNDYWVLRSDFVSITEKRAGAPSSDGQVGIVEISFRF
jgi:hypothetical protein